MNLDNITPEYIEKILKSRIPKPEGAYKRSSVMVLLFYIENEINILYTQRAFSLNHQPGDICFPGGRSEGCETPLETALRETEEELRIDRKYIRVLGTPDFILTHFNGFITPFVGVVENIKPNEIKFSTDEVEKIFTVPLSFFYKNKPKKSYVRLKTIVPNDFPIHLIQQGENYNWSYPKYSELFYKYNDNVIWGLTARITNHICELLTNAVD